MDEIMEEPADVVNAPTIDSSLMAYNEDGICKLEFFETCADAQFFHDQWYRRPKDPDMCGHDFLPLAYDVESTCAYSYCEGEEWLMCQVSEQ